MEAGGTDHDLREGVSGWKHLGAAEPKKELLQGRLEILFMSVGGRRPCEEEKQGRRQAGSPGRKRGMESKTTWWGALLSLHMGKGVESGGQGRKPEGEGRKPKQPSSPGFHQTGWSSPQEGGGEGRWLIPEEKEKG